MEIVLLALLLSLLVVLKWALGRAAAGRDAASGVAGKAAARVPPTVPGLPLLGSVLALGSRGAAFLQECRQKYGSAFTLRLAGQRMTFVFAPAALQHYFSAPDTQLTFAPAFTHRVFGLPPKHFYHRHFAMLQASMPPALRHELVPSSLPQHTARLLRLLLAHLRSWPAAGQLDLVAELKALVFQASVALLFGPRFLLGGEPDARQQQQQQQQEEEQRQEQEEEWERQQQARVQQEGGDGAAQAGSPCGGGRLGSPDPQSRAQRLQQTFFVFEAGFELAASPVPHLLQPRFLAARRRLLAALRESHRAGHLEGTVAGRLVEACGLPAPYVANMLLALLWASQANAVSSAFWTIGFLLLPENSQHLAAVVAEAWQAAAAGAGGGGAAGGGVRPGARGRHGAEGEGWLPLSEAQQEGLVALAADRRSHAAAAVAEALRLRSFSVDVRIAAADVVVPCGERASAGEGIWVRKGDMVAISPYEEGMRLGGSTSVHGAVVGMGGVAGVSFGGGKYRCPGRYFAEAELALVTSLLLLLFDWQLLPRGQQGAAAPAPAAAALTSASRAQQRQQQRRQASVPGDPGGLLPPPDLHKLVGIKVPAEPCWVQYRRRQPPVPGS
ncbi:hypothetical protein CHLNCDRAFT_142513 [Chlorella variabilis]|uniref:Cytochrome P450 n=1 Tax=Chlorella variabilis TaxID=554065 RepID=E1ZTT4_CHLVA|nr:hypothetical protein CHLNCDRAFT_142513 [Chlorella variabilis]EFN50765.1 hypothetical protein CHLNCDRAFT_142513 [Chlorella variabilis]|eukprot:XP_005842877.1 hypothetical protein CHLNCDRAFT_142513 [Chlorella variabilis]